MIRKSILGANFSPQLYKKFSEKRQKLFYEWSLEAYSTIQMAKLKTAQIIEALKAVMEQKTFKPSAIMQKNRTNPRPASIPFNCEVAITYRGSEKSDPIGMFYDHLAFQNITNRPTSVVLPTDDAVIKRNFEKAVSSYPYRLSYGIWNSGFLIPAFSLDPSESGLIVIPGRRSDDLHDPIRRNHERKLIKDAYNRGQPIFAICAGMWRLNSTLEAIEKEIEDELQKELEKKRGNNEKKILIDFLIDFYEETLIKVTDHSAASMPRPGKNAAKIVNNIEIHGLELEPNSLIEQSMKTRRNEVIPDIIVNSVHNKALHPQYISSRLRATAFSVNAGLDVKCRSPEFLEPQEQVIEGIESQGGVPMIGVQWHPEAYNNEDDNRLYHLNMIKYMTKTGETYRQKRNVIAEIISLQND